MMRKKFVLTLAGLLWIAISASAQSLVTPATQQQQTFQQRQDVQQSLLPLHSGTNAPETYPGENEDIGPQYILRLVQRRTYFQVRVDSEYVFTDNALLTEKPTQSTMLWQNSISAAYAPTPYKLGDGRFAPTVGLMAEWFNYGMGGDEHFPGGAPLSSLDFSVQTAFVGGRYLAQNNWTFFGEADYNRFLNQGSYTEFYRDVTPMLGVQKLFVIQDDLVLAASTRGEYHVSHTSNPPHDSQDRFDQAVTVALSYQVFPKCVLQPSYVFQYTHYNFNTAHTSSRNDYLNTFGVSLSYNFNPNLSLRTFVDQSINVTDDSAAASYRNLNAGLALNYSVQF